MNAIFRAVIFFVVLVGTPLVANAENWKAIEGLDGQYMDVDSSSRNGDLATIKKRRVNAGFEVKETLTFDCVHKTLEEPNGIVSAPKELEPVLVKACKRSYEFWK